MNEQTKAAAFASIKSAVQDIREGERAVVFRISDATIDRDNEVLLPQGAQLAEYRKNSVVLWAHSWADPPIAKAQWTKYDAGAKALISKAIFAETPFSDEIFQLYKGGFLKGVSVGFDSMDCERRAPTAAEIKANPDWATVRSVVTKWPLLEYSCVPIPANPNALAEAVAKGLVSSRGKAALGIEEAGEAGPETETPDGAQAESEAELEIAAESDAEPEAYAAAHAAKAIAIRRVVSIPPVETRRKVVIRRVVALPSKKDLLTAERVLALVQKEIDWLKGRC